MSDNQDSVNRRDFMAKSVAAAGVLGAAKGLLGKPARSAATGKVLGSNDRIQVGIIGVGGRGATKVAPGSFAAEWPVSVDALVNPLRSAVARLATRLGALNDSPANPP